MNKDQLSQAVALAQSGQDIGILETDKFSGFGLLNFEPVYCTITELAQLIRWQCCCLNGSFDGEALDEICQIGRQKFMLVGQKFIGKRSYV